jgi:hypothetical protein
MHNRIGERAGDHFADVGDYEAPNFIFDCRWRYPGDERINLFMQPKNENKFKRKLEKNTEYKFAYISATL